MYRTHVCEIKDRGNFVASAEGSAPREYGFVSMADGEGNPPDSSRATSNFRNLVQRKTAVTAPRMAAFGEFGWVGPYFV